MLGAILAVLSAATFASHNTAVRRAMLVSSALSGIYVTVTVGAVLFLVAAGLSGQLFRLSELSTKGYLLLTGSGLVHFLVGRYCVYRCIGAIGASRMTLLNSMAIPVAVVVAVLLLDERVTLLMGLGIALVMAGPFVMIQRGERRARRPAAVGGAPHPAGPSTTAPPAAERAAAPPMRMAEGYVFGLLSAVAFGTTPVMIREALKESDLSLLGGLISFAAAVAVLLLLLSVPGRLAGLRETGTGALRLFFVGALLAFLAQMFRFLALGMAPVTVVAPLMHTSPAFTALFTFIVNRSIERLGAAVILGVILVVAGSFMLTAQL